MFKTDGEITELLDLALRNTNENVSVLRQRGKAEVYDVTYEERNRDPLPFGTITLEKDALRTRVILKDISGDVVYRVSFGNSSEEAKQREMKKMATQLAML
jgi:hypothetical protein